MHRGWHVSTLTALSLFSGAASAQIPEGYELIQITHDDDFERNAEINNCGQVAFSKLMGASYQFSEVFLYDNGHTTRLTQNSVRDILPQVNNNGMIVWARRTNDSTSQILTWKEGNEVVLIEDSLWIWPDDVNDFGQLVWGQWLEDGCAESNMELYLYDGSSSEPLTLGEYSYQGGEISNEGHIVFTRYDFCQEPWRSEVVYLHDGVFEPISGGQQYAQVPDINDAHQIVWDGSDESGDYIWSWRDGKAELLIEDGGVPHANSHGDVCFWRWLDGSGWFHSYLYAGGNTYQLTFENGDHFPDGINDLAEVVIRADYGHGSRGDLFILRRKRTGDYDFDGRINLPDHATLTRCMTDPDWYTSRPFDPSETLCECRLMDLDDDGDVDLKDFGVFQNRQAW